MAGSTAVIPVSWAVSSLIPLCIFTRHSVLIYDCMEGMQEE